MLPAEQLQAERATADVIWFNLVLSGCAKSIGADKYDPVDTVQWLCANDVLGAQHHSRRWGSKPHLRGHAAIQS